MCVCVCVCDCIQYILIEILVTVSLIGRSPLAHRDVRGRAVGMAWLRGHGTGAASDGDRGPQDEARSGNRQCVLWTVAASLRCRME